MLMLLRTTFAYSIAFLGTVTIIPLITLMGLFDKPGRAFWPLARFWGFVLTQGAGVRGLQVIGRENIPRDSGVILMPNHESHLDPPTVIRLSPVPVRFIAKASLFRIPVFGWGMWAAGMIPIDRSNQKKAFASIDRAAEAITMGKTVLVFPEGTRTPDGDLQGFKKGGFVMAVRAGVPIIPLGIAGTRAIMPPGFGMEKAGPVVVVVGEAIDITSYDLERKDEVMALVRERIADLRDEAYRRRAAL